MTPIYKFLMFYHIGIKLQAETFADYIIYQFWHQH